MTAPLLRLTCKQAHRVIAESLDRDLKVMDDVRVRLHLRRCPCCAEFVKQMDLMRSAMRRIGR
ncbi:MAG TPA: anti-sigma factor [Burkholderiaceae bacterium]|nr:anti-sigma factor [Burkholderiaceae bacterium]